MEALENYTGLELGELVNNKKLSAVEVIDYFEDRISTRNDSINAFVYTKFDEARARAKELDTRIFRGEYVGPFAGVPVGLKDFLPSKKGWTASHGGVEFLITEDEVDGTFCEAAEGLGAIAVGKTNAPSFGFRGTCDNKMYGPTSTPFNVEYNSGGSSGGSASAVADGLVPLCEGGDAGGSIRIPSAWCGCYGFKPSAGLVPSVCRPDAWTASHPYCCSGPITRSVKDALILLSRMIQYNPRDPVSVPFTNNIRNASSDIGRRLRVGYTIDFNLFPEPEPTIFSEFMNLIDTLKEYDVEVIPVEFNFSYSRKEMEEAWLRGICIDTAIDWNIEKQKDPTITQKYIEYLPEQFTYWNQVAFNSDMMDYRRFHEIRTDILDAHLEAFKNIKTFRSVDVILSPLTGCMPVKNATNNDTKGPDNINGQPVDPLIGFCYTYLENMIGFPAASIPIGVDKITNLPIGAQIIAPRYKDIDIFSLSLLIEKIKPWDYSIPYNRAI